MRILREMVLTVCASLMTELVLAIQVQCYIRELIKKKSYDFNYNSVRLMHIKPDPTEEYDLHPLYKKVYTGKG